MDVKFEDKDRVLLSKQNNESPEEISNRILEASKDNDDDRDELTKLIKTLIPVKSQPDISPTKIQKQQVLTRNKLTGT